MPNMLYPLVSGYKLLVRDTCIRLHVSGVNAALEDGAALLYNELDCVAVGECGIAAFVTSQPPALRRAACFSFNCLRS